MAFKRSRSSVVRSGLGRTAAASAMGYGIRKITSYFKPKRGSSRRVYSLSRMRRRSRSNTRVARRSKARTALAENMSSNYSKFVYGYGPRRKPRLSKNLAPILYYRNGKERLGGGPGIQAVNVPIPLYHFDDLRDIDTQMPGGDNQWTRHLGCTFKLMMTNQSEAPCKIKVYHCLTRRSTTRSPVQTWSDGATSQFTGGGTATVQYVGSVPMATQKFSQFYVVKKISNIDLPPGGNATVTVMCKNFATIKEQFFRTGSDTYFAGLTYFPLIVMHGYPLNQQGTPGDITTAGTAVDLVWTKTFYFTYIERIIQGGNTDSSLLTVLPNPFSVRQTDGTVDIMNEA